MFERCTTVMHGTALLVEHECQTARVQQRQRGTDTKVSEEARPYRQANLHQAQAGQF